MEVVMNHDTITNDEEGNFISEVYTDVEDPAEAGLKARRRHQFSEVVVPVVTKADNGDEEEPSKNSTYLDKYGGAIEDLNIQRVLNSVQYDANNNGIAETETEIKAKSEQIEEEITEEEVVELEFDKAKRNTHTMHCPNCDHQITKVVLRRKIIRRQPPVTEQRQEPPVTEQQQEPLDLLGCFSCFSLFTNDNGGFNPFPIFGNNKPTPSAVANGNSVVHEDGNCFSIFRVFRKEKDSQQPEPGKVDPPSLPITEIKDVLNKLPIRQGQNGQPDVVGEPSKPEYQLRDGGVPSNDDQPRLGAKLPAKDDTSIDILPDTRTEIQDPPRRPAGQDSTSFEILKSIVYGGLMEVIASLSIVASAAAGDASTLNIIALALANLVGGIFVIGHNLWDLRDDCHKSSTEQTNNNQEARNKYKELLGSVEHFPLHAFFAILSFLVFGVIPPVVYGYSFHETNDTDFTMVIVAGVSLVCVGLLAIFKARIEQCTMFSGYVKTITYYLTTAVATSGVSYAVGNLAKRLIEELGLFETSSNVATGILPEVVSMNPALAYY
ncbi:uncharacterized protein LOC143616707 [Bidens hawaiensis]|uniref:uncharacterized protein LOC143616707 n=1 Tax=Bidens hawaiensis TaxID=980011 RepID=UPI004049CAFC